MSGRKLILLVAPPKGYVHIFDGTRIEWGDLWFRPCDETWVEVGAGLVGGFGNNPSTVCARREGAPENLKEYRRTRRLFSLINRERFRFSLKEKFDKTPPVSETSTMTKLYNIGAHGIPDRFLFQIRSWNLDLFWSTHALTEAVELVKNFNLPQTAFPKSVTFGGTSRWEVVELEVSDNSCFPVTKVVARRPVEGTKWSLVLVIKPDGVVKTCWANLTSDTHRTLDISKYSKA